MYIKIKLIIIALLFSGCAQNNKINSLPYANNAISKKYLSNKCENLEFLKQNIKKQIIYNYYLKNDENIPIIKFQNKKNTKLMKIAQITKFEGVCAPHLEHEQIKEIGLSNEFIPIKKYRNEKKWQNFRYKINERFYENKNNNFYPKEIKGEFIGDIKSDNIFIGLWVENNVSKLATYSLNNEGQFSNAIIQLEIHGILDRIDYLPTLHTNGGTLYLPVKNGDEIYFLEVGFNYGYVFDSL